jgi:hypothetical protein
MLDLALCPSRTLQPSRLDTILAVFLYHGESIVLMAKPADCPQVSLPDCPQQQYSSKSYRLAPQGLCQNATFGQPIREIRLKGGF